MPNQRKSFPNQRLVNARTITIEPQVAEKQTAITWCRVDGEKFVLRIGGENAAAIGIRRATECAAIRAAASIGVAPEVVAFLLPQGTSSRALSKGIEWSVEDFKQPRCDQDGLRKR